VRLENPVKNQIVSLYW